MSGSQYPPIYAGAFPDADTLQALAPMVAWKTAAATARTSTTLVVDPDLQLALVADATYDVTADVNYSGAGGLQFGWTLPSGVGGAYTAAFNLAGTGAGAYAYAWTATPAAAAADNGLRLGGTLWTGSSGGTLGFNWGAGTSGDSVQTGAGGVLRARRIA